MSITGPNILPRSAMLENTYNVVVNCGRADTNPRWLLVGVIFIAPSGIDAYATS